MSRGELVTGGWAHLKRLTACEVHHQDFFGKQGMACGEISSSREVLSTVRREKRKTLVTIASRAKAITSINHAVIYGHTLSFLAT